MARKKLANRDLYRQTVELPRGPRGGRRRRAVYAKTVGELKRKVAELQASAEAGMIVNKSAMTFSEHAEAWFDRRKRELKPGSIKTYSTVLKHTIYPAIGSMRLQSVTLQAAQSCVDTGASASRRQSTCTLIKMIMRAAVDAGIIAVSPCDRLRAAGGVPETLKVWSPDEAKRFIVVARDHRLYAMWLMAITRGLRVGELIALTPNSVDLMANTVTIRETYCQASCKMVTAKTSSSRRTISLTSAVGHAVADWLAIRASEGNAGSSQLFCAPGGGYMYPATISIEFGKLIEAAGVPRIVFHGLRHTAATLMLSRNVHPKVVSDTLGHSSVSITMDTYSHAIPSISKSGADAIDEFLAE